MASIDFTITRETDDESTDLTVTVEYEHDAYGIAIVPPVGIEFSPIEKDALFEAIREQDGEAL